MNKHTIIRSKTTWIFAGVMLLLSILFYHDRVLTPPTHLHAWTQTDRLCLSEGFIDNHFDFFHPKTYKLDPQYGGDENLKEKEGITSVDFPIHEYVVALAMKFIGTKSPGVFRIYLLLYSIVGLFFLFHLAQLFQVDKWASLFICVFIFTAPVYNYFQAGFIPSIPAFANMLIGLYFYFQYRINKENKKSFLLSICFLTLATLTRTPFFIFLFGTTCLELLDYWKAKKVDWKRLGYYGISFLVVGGYFLYNTVLFQKYGSIFLNKPLPAEHFLQFKEKIASMLKNWTYHYFSISHYIVINTAVFLLIWKLLAKIKLEALQRDLLKFILLITLGVSFYAVMMIVQFESHDYYFIDTFYPVIFLFLLWCFTVIKINYSLPHYITFGLLTIGFISEGLMTKSERYQNFEWDKIQHTVDNFQGSHQLLKDLGIPEESSILVLNAFSPNIPMYYMRRPSYSVFHPTKSNIKNAILTYDVDYVLVQDEYFLSHVVTNFPKVINHLYYVGGNENLTLYKRLYPGRHINLVDFYEKKLGDKKSYVQRNDFEQEWITGWNWASGIPRITKSDHYNQGGSASAYVSSEIEYGCTFQTTIKDMGLKDPSAIVFDGAFMTKTEIGKTCVVVSLEDHYGNYFFREYKINKELNTLGEWKEVYNLFYLPKIRHEDDVLKIFIWNPSKSFMYYDDLSFLVY